MDPVCDQGCIVPGKWVRTCWLLVQNPGSRSLKDWPFFQKPAHILLV